MKVAETITLIAKGPFAESKEWAAISKKVHQAVEAAEWPPESGKFTIHPESGKKSGQGNGVVPIKKKPMAELAKDGWTLEKPWSSAVNLPDEVPSEAQPSKPGEKVSRKGKGPGNIDAFKQSSEGPVLVEWETGNVSSSHRSINKMALGLVEKKCIAGVLVVPNMKLARYLTDRIGNIDELRPYFPMWRKLDVENGVLQLVVIEQDAESTSVPKIPKGKDGRAKEGADALSAQLIAKEESRDAEEDELSKLSPR